MDLRVKLYVTQGNMILVDTTIWIEFFKSNPAYFSKMESLLESNVVITIEPIFAELLYGS